MPLDIFFSSLPRFLSVLLDADQCLTLTTLTLTHALTLTLTLTLTQMFPCEFAYA